MSDVSPRDAAIVAAYAAGEPVVAIAARHGVTGPRVRQIARDAGLPSRDDRATPEVLDAAAGRARAYLVKHLGREADLPTATDDLIALFLVRTHSDLALTRQIEVLGLPRGTVKRLRAALAAAGRISFAERAGRMLLTPGHIAAIRRLYADGYSREAIVAMRQISEYAVDAALYRRGAPPARGVFYGKAQVAAMFGVTRDVVDGWLAVGWLAGAKSAPECRSSWHRWRRADLAAFVRVRAAWITYQPTHITDPELRRLAEAEQTAAGGQWVASKEIAAMLRVPYSTFKHYTSAHGYLRDWPTAITYGRTRYYWLRDGEALPPLRRRKEAA